MDAEQSRYHQEVHPLYAELSSLKRVLHREHQAELDEDGWFLVRIWEVSAMEGDLAEQFRICR